MSNLNAIVTGTVAGEVTVETVGDRQVCELTLDVEAVYRPSGGRAFCPERLTVKVTGDQAESCEQLKPGRSIGLAVDAVGYGAEVRAVYFIGAASRTRISPRGHRKASGDARH